MRAPLPVLAAALAVVAAGVVMLNVAVPAKPASIFINATALQFGQNITLHLSYVPMNVTVIASASAPMTALCIYFHGTLRDQNGVFWLDRAEAYIPANYTRTMLFQSAGYFRDTSVTILVTGQDYYYDCPPSMS
jgi:hypothetical protein